MFGEFFDNPNKVSCEPLDRFPAEEKESRADGGGERNVRGWVTLVQLSIELQPQLD